MSQNTDSNLTATPSNFLIQRLTADQQANKHQGRIETRFPPEPNGYLHIGHAKSICLNFGLAQQFNGVCHLRFDDTNPSKENQEYVDSIRESVSWLGFDWGQHEYFASDYFPKLFEFAVYLIEQGLAYVDSQSADEIRANRGNLQQAGINSPYRERSIAENKALFLAMKNGEYAEGIHVLRAKIDMASSNINLRDPAIYRIRNAHHHRTGHDWCIYPMYDYAHCVSDALEKITHSICTLEFEDHRPLYNWYLIQLANGEFFNAEELPQQIEFARLNLGYTITSKRKLLQLVEEKKVNAWDDPRMPTLAGIRRRGYTAESIRLFCQRIGVTKADSLVEAQILEQSLRDCLEEQVSRAVAVLNPLKLVITNFDDINQGLPEKCHAPVHPHFPERGERHFDFTRELWIEREDFMIEPSKGFFRLSPNNEVRLRYGFIIRCENYDVDEAGIVQTVYATVDTNTKSGTPGSERKVKGNIHWLSTEDCVPAEIRIYDRLFTEETPEKTIDGENRSFLEVLNPNSLNVVQGFVENSVLQYDAETSLQIERHGYFVTDRFDHQIHKKVVLNKSIGLKDSFVKTKK
jgi:glutaminyl-tRNA synthetase